MSSPALYFILVVALAGLVVFFLKWRSVARAGGRLAAVAAAGSRRRLELMQSGRGPAWLCSLAGTLLEDLDEKESLRRGAEDRELFQTLLNEISHGFLIVDRDLEIRFANKAIAGYFAGPGTGENRRLIEVVHDHRLVDVVRDAVRKQARRSGEIMVEGARAEEGERVDRVFEIEAAPLPDDPQSGCWVMVRDITERVVTEQVRKDFVANASHELRTPLTLINGYIETLEDGLIDDRDASRNSLRIMRKHGQRIVRIIEDMLTISKLEGKETPLTLEPFDMSECVTSVIENLSSLIDQREATVEFQVAGASRIMTGDRFYWDQILVNLVENALKQNQHPGLKVSVVFDRRADTFVITVADDGVGISRADLPFVFKRFFRGAKHHSQEIKGTGLGLSIVKRAVEAHGGTVAIDSEPGVKTVVTLTVPVMEVEAVEKGEESAASLSER